MRRVPTDRAFAVVAAALALALAGCGSGGSAAGRDPAPGATRTAWPQPVDGRLTTDMCDLLGPDDYSAAGALAATFNERELTPKTKPTLLSCHSVGQNWLALDLQPDKVSGGLYYDRKLRALHKDGQGKPADHREDVVPGADASNYQAVEGGHDLLVRRGALIVELSMGFLNDEADQFAALTKLAGLVLRRTQAGTTDTGEPHHVTMTVTGRPARPGPVDISYLDPNLVELVRERSVTLPWTKTIDVAWYGQFRSGVTLDATLAKPALNRYLSCSIVIDGKKVDETAIPALFATCRGEFTEST